MNAHRTRVIVPTDHQVSVSLPDDFPAGPAEVIVLADVMPVQRVVQLAGVLTPDVPPLEDEDPIEDALRIFRRERQARFDTGRDPVIRESGLVSTIWE